MGRPTSISSRTCGNLACPGIILARVSVRVSARFRYQGTLRSDRITPSQQSLRPSSPLATRHCVHRLRTQEKCETPVTYPSVGLCAQTSSPNGMRLNGVIIVFKMTFIEAIPPKDIIRFCQRWQVSELALFGSVLRPDFKPESDVDVLISFYGTANWGLFDHVQMRLDLEAIFQRKVDLVTRRALEQTRNELLRKHILKTARVIFADNEAVYAEG